MAEKLYDAIIVGTGASGGWAAKDLTAQGMEVLVLDAGPMPEPSRDFVQHGAHPPDDPRRGLRRGSRRGPLRESTNGRLPLAFTEDPDHPFTTPPGKPFRWMRSRIVGGRTLHWGRASHRLSDLDFKAASRDGYGDDWPISHADLSPYYDRVEEHIGVSAYAEGFPQLPDGKFQPGMPYNCAEQIFVKSVRRMGLPATHRRIAQLSRPLLGRPPCHFCGACGQGCDIGAMFNSVVSTLPPAQATGRMTLRTDSIVRTVLMGDDGKAAGVSYIDRLTRQDYEARGKVVVLAASCLENNRILLNSAPGGIGNSSGVLGRYIMDQFSGGGATGFLPQLRGQQPRNTDGKSSGMFIPVFRNIKERHPKFIRGYCMSATGGQTQFPRYALSTPGYGKDFKTYVRDYSMAQARVWLSAGEMLPRYENRVEIDPEVKDAWGIPVLKITCTFSDNEHAMFADAVEMMKEVLENAGGEVLTSGGNISTPGGLFHEVGGCRMGSDPKTSVLDPFCRMHDVRNVYVFSGSPFVTTGPHHPTLTMMALTARGCDHLADQFKQGNV